MRTFQALLSLTGPARVGVGLAAGFLGIAMTMLVMGWPAGQTLGSLAAICAFGSVAALAWPDSRPVPVAVRLEAGRAAGASGRRAA